MGRAIAILAVALAVITGACGGPSSDAGPTTASTPLNTQVTPTTLPVAAATSSTTTTVVIGESDFVVVPDEFGGVPLDLGIGCPSGPTFPASALSSVEPLVGSGRDQIEAAIAGFLGSEEGSFWPQVDEWQILHETDEEVILVFIDPSRQSIGFQTVVLVDGEWRWSGSQLGEACPLEARLPDGLNRVNWRIDPEFGLDPESTTIHLLATERECASGQAMGDRLRSPHTAITDGEVRITLAADPPPGDSHDCPSNPEQSVTIELGMPLGNRAVVDGLVVLGDLADLIG
ncbi:MAG: hypothetical protein IH941_05365 [Acidobacteria bacterium]|nr:hypothetical protein [Acidobacteriota bacterium]